MRAEPEDRQPVEKMGRMEKKLRGSLELSPLEEIAVNQKLDSIGVKSDTQRSLIVLHQYIRHRATDNKPFTQLGYHAINAALVTIVQGSTVEPISNEIAKLTRVNPKLAETINSVFYTAYNLAFYQKIIDPSIDMSSDAHLLVKAGVYVAAGALIANKVVGTAWNLYRIPRRILNPNAKPLPSASFESAALNYKYLGRALKRAKDSLTQ